jgi:hypothetical protein
MKYRRSRTSEARLTALEQATETQEMGTPGWYKHVKAQESSAPASCPRCQAIDSISDKEIDRRLARDLEFFEGRRNYLGSLTDLPDHSPNCPLYQKTAARSEKEVDAKLAQLTDIMRKRRR